MDDQLRLRIQSFLAGGVPNRTFFVSGAYAVGTTVGYVRSENQDCGLIVKARYGGAKERDFDVAVVCDGLGGMAGGRDAAWVGVSCFIARLIRTAKALDVERVRNAIMHTNSEVYKLLRGSGGTTLSAVVIPRSGAPVVGHVGDSRVYVITSTDLRQISSDDTFDAVLNKRIDRPGAVRDTRLLQFVGMGEDLEAHVFCPGTEEVLAYLLTSDGAHDMPQNMLRQAAIQSRTKIDLARKLVQLSEILGGLDNATAVLLPPSPSDDEFESSEGLDLTLISGSAKMLIWIPQLLDEKREASGNKHVSPDNRYLDAQAASANSAGVLDVESDGPGLGSPSSPTHLKVRANKKSNRRARKISSQHPAGDRDGIDQGQASLPAQALEIKFPEREE